MLCSNSSSQLKHSHSFVSTSASAIGGNNPNKTNEPTATSSSSSLRKAPRDHRDNNATNDISTGNNNINNKIKQQATTTYEIENEYYTSKKRSSSRRDRVYTSTSTTAAADQVSISSSRHQQQQQQQRRPSSKSSNYVSTSSRGADRTGSNSIYYDKIYNEVKPTSSSSSSKLTKEPSSDQQQQQSPPPTLQVEILPQNDDDEDHAKWTSNNNKNPTDFNTTSHTADFSDFNDDARSTRSGYTLASLAHHLAPMSVNTTATTSSSKPATPGSCFASSMLAKACASAADHFGYACALFCAFASFVTPVLFIVLPLGDQQHQQQQHKQCGMECESVLISIAFKMFILLLASWSMYARRPRAIVPRLADLHALLVLLLFILTTSHWLFYSVRIASSAASSDTSYYNVLLFAASYVDLLLLLFVASVCVLELRHAARVQYVCRVVRSPDAHQCQYNMGTMSIQRAAVWLLEQYGKDFPVYNPWMDSANKRRQLQLLQLDNAAANNNNNGLDDNRLNTTGLSRKTIATLSNNNNNDRFLDEFDVERRVRKRRARLFSVTEEAFRRVRRVQAVDIEAASSTGINEQAETKLTMLEPLEAAHAVFTSIARDLRRYLRVTRQQPYYSRESIVAHLANCITYDMSARAFLQRYVNVSGEPLVFNEKTSQAPRLPLTGGAGSLIGGGSLTGGVNYHLNMRTLDQSWLVISDSALYQNIEDNLIVVLKQNDVTLMCTFKRVPRFRLVEDVIDAARNKFFLKLNSETTV